MRFTFILLLIIAGCHSAHSDSETPASASDLEITRDPRILISQRDKWDRMTLNGIGIGADESSIDRKKVSERQGDGWIVMRDSNRYRTTDGKITTVGVWNHHLLDKLGVRTQDDVERVFGKSKDYVHVSTSIHLYTYQDGHVHVVWNQTENRLNAVNLIKLREKTATP